MGWEKMHKEARRMLKKCDEPVLLHKSFSDLKHLPLLKETTRKRKHKNFSD